MTAEELATCLIPMDPAFPAPMGGGICHGVHGILRARIWLAIASISPLLTVVLWFGATSLDSFRDPAYGNLRDPV
jgi:hypothetical protein